MPRDLVLPLVASLILGSLPFIWILRHRGPRRRRLEEGKLDGALMLMSCFVSLMTVVMAGGTVLEWRDEQRAIAETRPVVVTVSMCTVSWRDGGADKRYFLFCRVRPESPRGDVIASVEAGDPASRRGLDEWISQHPPGTRIVLRQRPDDATVLSGLDQLVPAATTTSASGARGSLLFGALVAFLLLVSRMVVRRRNARLGNVSVIPEKSA